MYAIYDTNHQLNNKMWNAKVPQGYLTAEASKMEKARHLSNSARGKNFWYLKETSFWVH